MSWKGAFHYLNLMTWWQVLISSLETLIKMRLKLRMVDVIWNLCVELNLVKQPRELSRILNLNMLQLSYAKYISVFSAVGFRSTTRKIAPSGSACVEMLIRLVKLLRSTPFYTISPRLYFQYCPEVDIRNGSVGHHFFKPMYSRQALLRSTLREGANWKIRGYNSNIPQLATFTYKGPAISPRCYTAVSNLI